MKIKVKDDDLIYLLDIVKIKMKIKVKANDLIYLLDPGEQETGSGCV